MIKSQAFLPMILLLTMVTSNPQITLSSTPDPEPLRIEERWLVTWGGDDYESPRRIIHDGSHLYIYGRTLSHGDGESNIFLAKYDMEGGLQWDTVWETPTLDVPRGYALEGPHIYITGTTQRGEDPHGDPDVLQLKEFVGNGAEISVIVCAEASPSCGVTVVGRWKEGVPVATRKFPRDVDFVPGRGVYMEELEKLLDEEGIEPAWIGVPGKSTKKVFPEMFRETLKKIREL